jgi:hypothetical protein
VCRVLLLFFSTMPMMTDSGKFRLLNAGFYTGAITGVELPKEVFTSRARLMPLIIE